MAEPSESGKYLTLDNARVSYDSRNDQVILTSTDSELKALGGLKIDINGKNSNHLALRTLLERHGVIAPDLWPRISTWDVEQFYKDLTSGELVLGTNSYGNPVIWNLDEIAHLWLYGSEGSTLSRGLLGQAVEVGHQVHNLNVSAFVERDDNSAKWLIDYLERTIAERGGTERIKDRILISVSGLKSLGADPLHSTRFGRQRAIRIVSLIESIIELNRSANINLILEVEEPEVALVGTLDKLFPFADRRAATIVLNRVLANAVPLGIRPHYRSLESYAPRRAQLFVSGIDTLIEPLQPTGNRPTPADRR